MKRILAGIEIECESNTCNAYFKVKRSCDFLSYNTSALSKKAIGKCNLISKEIEIIETLGRHYMRLPECLVAERKDK